jgi:hypothetical protein
LSLEDTFRKLHGKPPSGDQLRWLVNVQATLGLHDNDAFWFVVLMLEHYNGLYQQYPTTMAEEAARAIEGARAAFADAARAEAAQARRKLVEDVTKTSSEIARRVAETPFTLHRITVALALLVAFGSLCLVAGYHLASGARPFWVNEHARYRAVSTVLGAPAGWMSFALMLPVAVHALRSGWSAVADAVDRTDKVAGWGLMAISIAATTACAVMLAKVV